MKKRVCICGGRNFHDVDLFLESMKSIIESENLHQGNTIIISGEARGADTYAKRLANLFWFEYEGYTPNWDEYGKAAGVMRNQKMLDSGLDLLIAFPGGAGTNHMKRICKSAGVKVIEISKR